jgi:hypothetical protein
VDLTFQPSALAELLASVPEDGDPLSRWDVVVPEGRGAPATLGSLHLNFSQRKVIVAQNPLTAVVSGTKRRVSSRGIERAGLDDDGLRQALALAEADEIRKAAEEGRQAKDPKDLNVSDKFYRQARRQPLLLVHVVQPLPVAPVPDGFTAAVEGRTLVAVGVSFPVLADGRGYVQRFAKYKINLTKARELYGNTEEVGDDEEVVEEEP